MGRQYDDEPIKAQLAEAIDRLPVDPAEILPECDAIPGGRV